MSGPSPIHPPSAGAIISAQGAAAVANRRRATIESCKKEYASQKCDPYCIVTERISGERLKDFQIKVTYRTTNICDSRSEPFETTQIRTDYGLIAILVVAGVLTFIGFIALIRSS